MHLKVRGDADSFRENRQQDEFKLIRRSVDFSSATKRMHTLAGYWKSSEETRRIKKKEIQKTPTILRLRSGTAKGNPLPKTVKLGRQSLRPVRSRTSTTTRSAIRRRRKLRSLCRETGWRYCREPRGNPPAAFSSSASQWQTSQWQTTSSEKWW